MVNTFIRVITSLLTALEKLLEITGNQWLAESLANTSEEEEEEEEMVELQGKSK